eukprot:TRINITY_DN55003_c0_g1_i1.p1 TRINITY_DN55003_c0_g1~~TRINITY_DN55003_c0_g1_i1.p1  ORF type:complete len:1276 (-),score=187.17 TRINITY_DN55003_c0_g1_i1:24-3851(-)
MQDYQIYTEIGKGKHSVVYKGRRKKTVDYFAIRSVEKSERPRILNEVELLHGLSHVNVLRFHSWYETTNHLWLIVEYCTGSDLLAMLKTDGRFPEDTVHLFSCDILSGLHYIHSRGVLYRDLKPSNLLVDGSAVVKLSDFRLAERVDRLGGAKAGTPSYMAAELFEDRGVPSFASDLWSLGCVMYELFVGQPPFVGVDLEALIQNILAAPLSPPSDLAPAADLLGLLDSLLQKDPLARCNWPELVEHPFWRTKHQLRQLPQQPFWDRYVTERRAVPAKQDSLAEPHVDVRRLSTTVQKNLHRELSRNSYGRERGEPDANFPPVGPNHDLEVDFGEAGAPEEDTPTPGEKQSRTSPAPDGDQAIAADGMEDAPVLGPQPASVAVEAPATLRPTVQQLSALPPPELLLHHPSDTSIKPIMMNNRIERIAEPRVPNEELPFTAHPLNVVVQFGNEQLEAFLTQVYKAIGGHTKVIDKYNALVYFQTLCVNSVTANLFVNSSLVPLFAKMLQNPAHPSNLKVQLCMAIGLLVRHATFINPDRTRTGIVESFVGLLRTEATDAKVRRRSAACLGELLFFIATLQPAEQEVWRTVDQDAIATLNYCLQSEDETTRHYAAKAIENIAGHNEPNYALHFATETCCTALAALCQSSKNEVLRSTAAAALARLCRLAPACLGYVVRTTLGPAYLCRSVASPAPSRFRQACLTLLNLMLGQCVAYYSAADPSTRPSFLYSQLTALKIRPTSAAQTQARETLLTGNVFTAYQLGPQGVHQLERELQTDGGVLVVDAVLSALEQSQNVVLRAKSLLSFFLLAFCGLKFMHLACERKLCVHIERLARDKDEYLRQCLQTLVKLLAVVAVSAVSSLALELETATDASTQNTPGTPGVAKDAYENLPVVVHVLTTPTLRGVIVSDAMLQWLGRCTAALEQIPVAHEETRRMLLSVIEAISQDATVLSQHPVAVVTHLLPPLVTALDSTNGDSRFVCLKAVTDVLTLLLQDHDLYVAGSGDNFSRGLDQLVADLVLPRCSALLADKDPVPLYALKLLNTVAGDNAPLLVALQSLGIADRLLSFFELTNRNNNVHNVRMIQKMMECPAIPKTDLLSERLVTNLLSVLTYSYTNNAVAFLEPCICIASNLLAQAAKSVPGDPLLAMIQPLTTALPLFLALASAVDQQTATEAANCVALAFRVYPSSLQSMADRSHIAALRRALSGGGGGNTEGEPVQVILRGLCACDRSQLPVAMLRSDDLLMLELRRLASGSSREVSNHARALLRELSAEASD